MPFATGGIFAGSNIQLGEPTEDDETRDDELRESMRTAGYLRGADDVIKVENGLVLVGHRCARIAARAGHRHRVEQAPARKRDLAVTK